MAMGHNLCLHFGGDFDVYEGYRVLTTSSRRQASPALAQRSRNGAALFWLTSARVEHEDVIVVGQKPRFNFSTWCVMSMMHGAQLGYLCFQ